MYVEEEWGGSCGSSSREVSLGGSRGSGLVGGDEGVVEGMVSYNN